MREVEAVENLKLISSRCAKDSKLLLNELCHAFHFFFKVHVITFRTFEHRTSYTAFATIVRRLVAIHLAASPGDIVAENG